MTAILRHDLLTGKAKDCPIEDCICDKPGHLTKLSRPTKWQDGQSWRQGGLRMKTELSLVVP